MATVEQYWLEYEESGFIKEQIPAGYRYKLPLHMGQGGFELWGDTTTCFACVSDIMLNTPYISIEAVDENILEFGQLYTGDVTYYKKKSEIFPVESGLNYLVTSPSMFGYKRIQPGVRLLNVGICYREKFIDTLPYEIPNDFWETAAAVLNPDSINLPSVSAICEQIRTCVLSGVELQIFIQGKCLEAFALTLDYVYRNKKPSVVYLSAQDRAGLEYIKTILQREITNPPSLKELSTSAGMNQKKVMRGFKQINGITIYGYLKRIRMEKALELLLINELSISQIAKSVGYQGDGHFQQAFKDVYGAPPRQLRKEMHPNTVLQCRKKI